MFDSIKHWRFVSIGFQTFLHVQKWSLLNHALKMLKTWLMMIYYKIFYKFGRERESERILLATAIDVFCLTWMRVTRLPLLRRLSTAHFNAAWLPLSLSIATATISSFLSPLFPFWLIISCFESIFKSQNQPPLQM